MKPKICVSFNYTEDKKYYYLMQAWNHNPKFDFVFADKTPEEIQSDDIPTIKSVLTKKIDSAQYLLVVVGRGIDSLHPDHALIGHRNWQCFEVEKAKELGKKIVVVKLDDRIASPEWLRNSGVSWARTFAEDSIINAIENA